MAKKQRRGFRETVSASRERFSLGDEAKEIAIEAAGGILSAVADAGVRATENKYDDRPLLRLGGKTLVGMGVKWLFGKSKGARTFVSAWRGHTFGVTLEELATSAGKK